MTYAIKLSLWLGIATLALAALNEARAQTPSACTYEVFSAQEQDLSDLPKEIHGSVICPQSELARLNEIYVAEFKGLLSNARLESWAKRYDDRIVEGGLSMAVVERTGTSANRFWVLKNKREFSETLHYIFTLTTTQGNTLVFAYTDTWARGTAYRGQLQSLHQVFASSEWQRRFTSKP